MKIYVKYLILFSSLLATGASFDSTNASCGTAAAGAFIAYALIEINDLKIINQEEIEN